MYFLSGTSLGQEGIGKYRKIMNKTANICSFYSVYHISKQKENVKKRRIFGIS